MFSIININSLVCKNLPCESSHEFWFWSLTSIKMELDRKKSISNPVPKSYSFRSKNGLIPSEITLENVSEFKIKEIWSPNLGNGFIELKISNEHRNQIFEKLEIKKEIDRRSIIFEPQYLFNENHQNGDYSILYFVKNIYNLNTIICQIKITSKYYPENNPK